MRILALDASTSNVGWCVAEDDAYRASGQYKPQGRGFDAVLDYDFWLDRTIRTYCADSVFYERPSGAHGNNWTNTLLGALWYVTWCRTLLSERLVVVSPAEVKATGYSKELLKYPALCAERWWSLPGTREYPNPQTKAARARFGDELDAIGCWLAGWRRMNEQ